MREKVENNSDRVNIPQILILHGWGRGAISWQKTKELLENNGFSVLAPDLPGFGENPMSPTPWTINDYVEWVENLCQENGFYHFFLLGHSFGGRVAIKFALKYPEQLAGLILVSAGGVENEKTVKELTAAILAPYAKKFSFLPGYKLWRKVFYRFILGRTDYLQAQGVMKETFKNIVAENLTPLLEKIRVKTLIVWGENDRTLPLSDGRLMNQKIPGSQLEVLPNIDHKPHQENPQKLVEIIMSFMMRNSKNR
jgi:pimeloyl-ACP methyl ester carboxylesterase